MGIVSNTRRVNDKTVISFDTTDGDYASFKVNSEDNVPYYGHKPYKGDELYQLAQAVVKVNRSSEPSIGKKLWTGFKNFTGF